MSGQIVYPGRPPGTQVETRDGVAMTHFDGYGHLSQVDFVMANGTPLPGAADTVTGFHINETGTYTVYADCAGRAEIALQTPIGPAKISLMLVLGHGGRTLHTVVSHLAPPDGSLALPYIQSDAEKLGVVTTNFWHPGGSR
ncbi:hypothetical protein MBSD_n2856 [Mizugakiibacter sediminis]|uniref:Uncharacterized protein n=1 Tax=Mizugakiibacter sediminis TaxID=1475481 RepID=A0A0K8QRG4_9GAMM|nr:hypothetical protein [Mizugakiibacter sediminis]GAP67529.1 hypothetical protein MBSD_n2856 [Mizugakiibacter sediminis]